MRTIICALSLVLLSGVAFGQSSESAPEFELADVHPSPPAATTDLTGTVIRTVRTGFYRGGRYQIRNASMVDLIRVAYGVDSNKVLGGPNWLELDRFDINAKAPADATAATLSLMLRSLLASRFELVVHNDKKELPTFALRAGKTPRLKESDGSGETGCKPVPQNGGFSRLNEGVVLPIGPDMTLSWSCHNITMAAFAEALLTIPVTSLGTNPLVDETGLKGAWDFSFKHHPEVGLPWSQAAANITIFDAVDKQLGLKLAPIKVPVPVIVVDGVNEKPTDNPPGVSKSLPVPPTEFEVADIKPVDPAGPERGGRNGVLPGGRVEYHGLTLKNLISIAWDVSADRIVGAPPYAETGRFDIVAKAPAAATSSLSSEAPAAETPIDAESLQQMMRALLTDRFKLAVHKDERPVDVYALLAVKPKLKRADPANRANCNNGPGADGIDPRIKNPALNRLLTCLNMTMAQFAEQLPTFASGYFRAIRSITDATGLDGAWDLTLSFSVNGFQYNGSPGAGSGPGQGDAAAQAPDPGQGISLPDAIEKELGLKLEVQKRPMPVLIVDHVEQKPTDN